MRIGRNNRAANASNRIEKNHGKTNFLIFAVLAATVLLIFWVNSMGKKAQETVTVIMYTEGIYKNEVITSSMIAPYEMLRGEFEKYAVTQQDGTSKRRVLLWEERDKLINKFAAYTLKSNTVAEYRDAVGARIDNSDNVLYSYPGKNIINLSIGADELLAFKTFLQPGDRINITGIYRTKEKVKELDEYGKEVVKEVETYREDLIFPDIMLADLLNSSGESILDLYASYKEKTVYQQAQLDANESFQKRVTPSTMLVALTPEEESLYYYYLGKDDISFKISLPQRTE